MPLRWNPAVLSLFFHERLRILQRASEMNGKSWGWVGVPAICLVGLWGSHCPAQVPGDGGKPAVIPYFEQQYLAFHMEFVNPQACQTGCDALQKAGGHPIWRDGR